MQELPRISIITPSLNQVAYIGQTIESVINQGYPNLQYIVMDGGSTDGTVQLLREYDDDLLWVSEKDNGQSHAINKGLELADGGVVSYLNSDDYLTADSLEQVGRYFQSHPEAAWLTGKCRIVDQNGHEIRRFVTNYKNMWLRMANYSSLQILNYISQPSTFWRRSVVDKVGYFDERLHYAMDYDLWLRIGREHKVHVIQEYLACFRLHESSKSGRLYSGLFKDDLEATHRYVRSPALLKLHAAHNQLIMLAYRFLEMIAKH